MGKCCCCCDSNLKGKWVWGLRVAAPRSKTKLPGAAQRRREGWWPDLNLELCYHITNGRGEEETELYACIEICPKGYIYKRRPQTLD
jgi:hypothetical protein